MAQFLTLFALVNCAVVLFLAAASWGMSAALLRGVEWLDKRISRSDF